MGFYDEVLVELVFAMGAALFVANAYALFRRQADARAAHGDALARRRPGSPVRGYGQTVAGEDLRQAPVARSVTYMLVGLIVAIWGLASMLS